MIKTIRINIPYSETESMNNVLNKKLREFNLCMDDIKIPHIASRQSLESHFGNWCYVFALDTSELRKTDLILDMPQNILEKSDLEGIEIGDRVQYSFSNSLMIGSTLTGRVFDIQSDEKMTMITISKGKSKVKGFRFYTGDPVTIEKI